MVLAAGRSSRLGQPKQLLPDAQGEPLVRRTARQLREAGCAPVLVVVGAEADAVTAAVAGLGYRVIPNPNFSDGMGTSIAAGVVALEESDTAAVLIANCDMPGIDTAHFRALLDASAGGTRRVASTYPQSDGGSEGGSDEAVVRGAPAVLPREDWPVLAALAGDTGARSLLRKTDTLTVFIRAGRFDIDTAADVARWRRVSSAELL